MGGEYPGNKTPIRKIGNNAAGDTPIKNGDLIQLSKWRNKSYAPMFNKE